MRIGIRVHVCMLERRVVLGIVYRQVAVLTVQNILHRIGEVVNLGLVGGVRTLGS